MTTFLRFNLFLSVKRCDTNVKSTLKWQNAVKLSAISSVVIRGFSSTKARTISSSMPEGAVQIEVDLPN